MWFTSWRKLIKYLVINTRHPAISSIEPVQLTLRKVCKSVYSIALHLTYCSAISFKGSVFGQRSLMITISHYLRPMCDICTGKYFCHKRKFDNCSVLIHWCCKPHWSLGVGRFSILGYSLACTWEHMLAICLFVAN